MLEPHEILGVSKNATTTEIKTAYRALTLQFHPDVNDMAGNYFHVIQSAYETLMSGQQSTSRQMSTHPIRDWSFLMTGQRPHRANGYKAMVAQRDVIRFLDEAGTVYPEAAPVLWKLADMVERFNFGDTF